MESNNLKKDPLSIGMIKSYNKERGYGFIKASIGYHTQNVFFHITNCFIKNPMVNKYVAFRVRIRKKNNKIEAYDINTLFFHSEELWQNRNKNYFTDLYILAYVDKSIMTDIIYSDYVKKIKKIQTDLQLYVKSYDIQNAVKSYTVRVVKSHIYKPGDDDTARVDYCADREYGIYLPSEIRLRDNYIDSILPNFSENIFYDRGFCPWQKMMEDFGNLEEYEIEAQKMTLKHRQSATLLYNKETHFSHLMSFLSDKINSIVKKNKDIVDECTKRTTHWLADCTGVISDIKIEDYI